MTYYLKTDYTNTHFGKQWYRITKELNHEVEDLIRVHKLLLMPVSTYTKIRESGFSKFMKVEFHNSTVMYKVFNCKFVNEISFRTLEKTKHQYGQILPLSIKLSSDENGNITNQTIEFALTLFKETTINNALKEISVDNSDLLFIS